MLEKTNSGYLVETEEKNFKVQKLPTNIDKKIKEVFEKNQLNPEKLIIDLKKLIDENPNEYYIYACLDIAYSLNDMRSESIELTKSVYNQFPNNLIARLAYLNNLAIDKKFDEINEICGNEISFESIIGKKENLDLPEYDFTLQILIRYCMNIGKEQEAKEYFNELKKFDRDVTYIRHEFFPEFIDTLKEGDSVKVIKEYIDKDSLLDINGWQGRISEIDLEQNDVFIEWDSETLKNIDFEEIINLYENELTWISFYVPVENIELCEPRDTKEDVEKTLSEIEDKLNEKYKIPNFPYELYDEISNLEVRSGRILTEVLATMQVSKKSFGKYNLTKLSEFIDISTNDLIKRLEDLENKGLIKMYYSSVLKKDRERWLFLKTDENFELHNKLQNKELSPKDLEKLYVSTI